MLWRRVGALDVVFFKDTATPEIYTLSLHDALPIGLQRAAHEAARAKGWHERPCRTIDYVYDVDRVAALLVMIHSEVSEATEALRDLDIRMRIVDGKPEGLVVELADVVIRVADLCGALGVSLSDAVDAKLERSEEHTSELQSHSFISYAVFCL